MSVPPSPEIATGTPSGAATDEAMLAATEIFG